jgi:hypothetical protein
MDDNKSTSVTVYPYEVGHTSLPLQLGGACVHSSKLLSEMLTECTTTTNLITPFATSQIASWMIFCSQRSSGERLFSPDALCNVLKVWGSRMSVILHHSNMH